MNIFTKQDEQWLCSQDDHWKCSQDEQWLYPQDDHLIRSQDEKCKCPWVTKQYAFHIFSSSLDAQF